MSKTKSKPKSKKSLRVADGRNRSCGTCTACCTILGVPDIGKKAGETCQHLTEKRCSIYADRPLPCQQFRCLWLMGLFEGEHRPDRFGLMLSMTGSQQQAVQVNEVVPGASRSFAGHHFLSQLREVMVVIVVPADPTGARRLLGPPDLVQAYMADALNVLEAPPAPAKGDA